MARKAIVTLVVGKNYQRNFARVCHANWKAYADRHGLDLVILDTLPDQSARAKSRSAAWQKCLVTCEGEARSYDQVAWVDSDIVMNEAAPDIFSTVPADHIGAVEDYTYPTRDGYRTRLDTSYKRWTAQGVKYQDNLTPQSFLENWGLPPQDHVVQTGVFVVNPEEHGPLLRHTYDVYEDKGTVSWNYEMRPLSYEMVKNAKIHWLDLRFNVVTLFAHRDDELDLISAPHSLTERITRKLHLPDVPQLYAKNRKLAAIYKRMLDESYFLHFAGRQQDMRLLNV